MKDTADVLHSAKETKTDTRTNFDEVLPNNTVRSAIIEIRNKYAEAFRRLS